MVQIHFAFSGTAQACLLAAEVARRQISDTWLTGTALERRRPARSLALSGVLQIVTWFSRNKLHPPSSDGKRMYLASSSVAFTHRSPIFEQPNAKGVFAMLRCQLEAVVRRVRAAGSCCSCNSYVAFATLWWYGTACSTAQAVILFHVVELSHLSHI